MGDPAVSARELELAKQFLDALAVAVTTGDTSAIYPFLAEDVDWLTPQAALHGIGEVHDRLTWISPRENLEVEFGELELTEGGSGRIVTDFQETYRMKETGDFAYARDRRVELTIRGEKIARYEMRFAE
jgi:hypothetical protein